VIEYDATVGGSPRTELFVVYDRADGHVVSFHGFVGDVPPQSAEERERVALRSLKNRKPESVAVLRVPADFKFESGVLYKVAVHSRSLEVARRIGKSDRDAPCG